MMMMMVFVLFLHDIILQGRRCCIPEIYSMCMCHATRHLHCRITSLFFLSSRFFSLSLSPFLTRLLFTIAYVTLRIYLITGCIFCHSHLWRTKENKTYYLFHFFIVVRVVCGMIGSRRTWKQRKTKIHCSPYKQLKFRWISFVLRTENITMCTIILYFLHKNLHLNFRLKYKGKLMFFSKISSIILLKTVVFYTIKHIIISRLFNDYSYFIYILHSYEYKPFTLCFCNQQNNAHESNIPIYFSYNKENRLYKKKKSTRFIIIRKITKRVKPSINNSYFL